PTGGGDQERGLPDLLFRDGLGRAHERIVDAATIRPRAFFRDELYVVEAAAIQVRAQQHADPRGVLLRNEAEVDLHHRLGRNDRLRALTCESRDEAADVAGRLVDRREPRL